MAIPCSVGRIKDAGDRYRNFIRKKVSVRTHMSLILTGAALAGVIASKIMQISGMEPLWFRYLLNVLISYAFFLIFIKVWLMYISPDKTKNKDNSVDLSGVSIPDSGGVSVDSSPNVSGGGGNFGGGGSSGSWASAESSNITQTMVIQSSTSESGSGSGFNLDIPDLSGADEGILPILILLALGAALLAVFGGAAFLVYQAPTILSDAAFQFMLSAGLLKSAKQMSTSGWIGSVMKRSWIPFALMAFFSSLAGWVIATYCPGAQKLSQAISMCVL